MTDITGITSTIDTYLASWNETDPTSRVKLIEAAWDGGGRHVDPIDDVHGHAALDAYVAGVQERFPDHRLERVSGIDTHHDQVRFGWRLVGPDGAVVVMATDIGELAPDGKLRRISAFFGDPPELDASAS